ncbi:Oidioi.mRNA.OKI2018_I69.chr1.g3534.t1.cds [Oikopleura dioica]|uniref:Oidioi.mRNA.OKI2018_I69.chr1.g3534.t1.cds n=1 Tax=Oikopleura dioica TaxID=34765 RepID=A0ABN7SUF7_OIKDI|nr:Oidioi.mRNA.OKI2018_I69.chr1.g3534.t1.cds [Oikopleura dioica]
MDDDKIEALRSRLGQGEVKDFEKNCVKWVDQALRKLHGEFMNDYAAVDLIGRVINAAKTTNTTQLLSPHILSWANDILSRIRQASNSDAYLSILLILLSSFGGPCRQVKRKMWLNLATFASSPDHILRLKAATILSAASTKDQFEDLYNEMLLLLDQISPMLLSKNVEKPEERTLETLNTSLLIFNQSFVENEEELEESAEILYRRLHFTVSFLRGHILYHGCVDFPVEDFFAILRHTAVDPAVLRLLSSLALSIVKSYSQELLLVNNNVAEVLSGLYAADKAGVADAIEETLLEWINQLGVLGSLHRTKNFEKLALKILKKLQKNDADSNELRLNLKPMKKSDEENTSLQTIASGLKRLESKLEKLGTQSGVCVPTNGAREHGMEVDLTPSAQKGVGARRRPSLAVRENEEETSLKNKNAENCEGSDYESDSQNAEQSDTQEASTEDVPQDMEPEPFDSGEESFGEEMEDQNAEMETIEVVPSKIRRLEEPSIIISQTNVKHDKEGDKAEKEVTDAPQVEPSEELKRLMGMFNPSMTP